MHAHKVTEAEFINSRVKQLRQQTYDYSIDSINWTKVISTAISIGILVYWYLGWLWYIA